MCDEIVLRALTVPVPGTRETRPHGVHLAMTVKPAFSTALTLWFESSFDFGGDLGAAAIGDADLLAAVAALARGAPPPPAPTLRTERAYLSSRASSALFDELLAAGLFALPSRPITGCDGLTMAVLAHSPMRGTHRFDAWSPSGDHTRVLRALAGAAARHLRGVEWVRRVVDEALAQIA